MKPPNDNPSSGSFSLESSRPKVPTRILCVEDNDGDFRLFQLHLGDSPLKPRPSLQRARTLSEAAEHISSAPDQSGPFDLIVLDLSLPDSAGPATYFRLRNLAPETAIVILSGTTDHELSLEMVQHGAQDYLPKDTLSGDLLGRSLLYALERQRVRMGMKKLNDQLQRTTCELQTTQMHLIQAEKLESLGRLAAGVAHEVKNPLGVLQMGVDYFSNKTATLGGNAELILANMQEAITRADTIIHDMLDFSRSDQLKMNLCNVNELMGSSLRMVHHELLKNKITIIKTLATNLPNVRVDGAKLEQVLINIIMNAAQAMPSGGPLLVSTFSAEFSESSHDEGSRDLERLRSGDEVIVLEVRDHGSGIPEEILPRIFEPFFTTKPTGEGTGLGLAVARRIVELHRGRLQMTNMTSPTGVRARIVLQPDFSLSPQAAPSIPQAEVPTVQFI